MFPLPDFCGRPLLAVLAAACLLVTLPRLASAQQQQVAADQKQERGLLDRINNPDRTLAFPLSDKEFAKTSTYKNKEAYVRPFVSKDATWAGDGRFHAKTFGGDNAYKAKSFDTRSGFAGQKSFAQNNKLFDTAGYDVRSARDANREAATRDFDLHGPYSIPGKRQDTYDELLKRKKLSIEEVRELLNKNQ